MNMNYMNLSLAWMGALNMALALSGCTNGIPSGAFRPGGNPGDGTCRDQLCYQKRRGG